MHIRTVVSIAVLVAFIESAREIPGEKDASIPFANLEGIADWRADGDRALYVQGRNRQWYHAELLGFCAGLPFAQRVGFVIEPTGDFDRFASILVNGQQCLLKSFSASGPPPKNQAKSVVPNTSATTHLEQ